jgi:hypothetical protein
MKKYTIFNLFVILIYSSINASAIDADSARILIRKNVEDPGQYGKLWKDTKEQIPKDVMVLELAAIATNSYDTLKYGQKRHVYTLLKLHDWNEYEEGVNAILLGLHRPDVKDQCLLGIGGILIWSFDRYIDTIIAYARGFRQDTHIFGTVMDGIVAAGIEDSTRARILKAFMFDTTLPPLARIKAAEAWLTLDGLSRFLKELEDLDSRDSVITLGTLRALKGSGSLPPNWMKNASVEARQSMGEYIIEKLKSENETITRWAVHFGLPGLAGRWYYQMKEPEAKPYVDRAVSILNDIAETNDNPEIVETARRAIVHIAHIDSVVRID